MAAQDLDANLALFCDFENVALGVRDARMSKFDMTLVLERLLLKGNIVVKKAYCDWERYKDFKKGMHDAAFELIEIPHTRQSGKNSADIRMVVDALDLCYTKEHIDTFVIISGDSDFSPLVSKLRENAKTVVGIGVKNSTSDLLMKNCDEFIFYDDLVRASDDAGTRRRPAAKKPAAPKEGARDGAKEGAKTAAKPAPAKADAAKGAEKPAAKAKDGGNPDEGIELVVETADALAAERGTPVWGSMVKQTLRRRHPGFSESYYGFRSFGDLLEEAEDRGLLDLELDERSGGYTIRAVHRDG
jgi:uncharacterized protein (TIGR00288 family)